MYLLFLKIFIIRWIIGMSMFLPMFPKIGVDLSIIYLQSLKLLSYHFLVSISTERFEQSWRANAYVHSTQLTRKMMNFWTSHCLAKIYSHILLHFCISNCRQREQWLSWQKFLLRNWMLHWNRLWQLITDLICT
jgi:hypothetical protein